MVSRNSLSMALGLVLTVCMMAITHSSDPVSMESFENNEIKSNGLSADKRPAFFVGSRYGRSPQFQGSKSRRFSIAPRSDRFFLGSRYGKRADELEQPTYEQTSLNKLNTPFTMSCIYTGIKNFYRCSNANDINDVLNQLATEEIQINN